MKKVFSFLALAIIFMVSCQKEELKPDSKHDFIKIIEATCINDYGIIVPCKVTNKGDIIEMYNEPLSEQYNESVGRERPRKGGFCTLDDGSTGTFCPGGNDQVCIGTYSCTYCANCNQPK
jgi:hypothetical protein